MNSIRMVQILNAGHQLENRTFKTIPNDTVVVDVEDAEGYFRTFFDARFLRTLHNNRQLVASVLGIEPKEVKIGPGNQRQKEAGDNNDPTRPLGQGDQ